MVWYGIGIVGFNIGVDVICHHNILRLDSNLTTALYKSFTYLLNVSLDALYIILETILRVIRPSQLRHTTEVR